MKLVPKWSILVFSAWSLLGCGSFDSRQFSKKIYYPIGTGTTPVQAPTGNLLKNPSFEDGVLDWENWGASQELAGSARSGGRALRVIGQGGRGQEVLHRLKTGATYQLKAYGRISTQGDDVNVGVRFFDVNNRTISEIKSPVRGTVWEQVTVKFTVPQRVSSAKIFVWKNTTSSAPADFDDFELLMTSPPMNPPALPGVANPNNYRPSGPSGDWTLVFNDDFNGGSLDSTTWNTGFWFNSTLNNELQAYRPENVNLTGGFLNLLAERRSTTTTWGAPMNYASGAVTTRGKFTFTFGTVEARLRIPKGKGFYPAFWILPDGKRAPPEIDIMEILGQNPNIANFNYHFLDGDANHMTIPGAFVGPDFSADFHTFTVEWTPTYVRYYVDGIQRHEFNGDFMLRDPGFLILNLAVGGTWPGSPDDSTLFPQSYQVDYVRVWQQ